MKTIRDNADKYSYFVFSHYSATNDGGVNYDQIHDETDDDTDDRKEAIHATPTNWV